MLSVNVVEEKKMMKMEFGVMGKGKYDKYEIINIGEKKLRNKKIDNNVNKKWE